MPAGSAGDEPADQCGLEPQHGQIGAVLGFGEIPAVTNAVDTTPDRGEDDDDQQGQPAQGGPLKWPLCDRCTEQRTKHNMYQAMPRPRTNHAFMGTA